MSIGHTIALITCPHVSICASTKTLAGGISTIFHRSLFNEKTIISNRGIGVKGHKKRKLRKTFKKSEDNFRKKKKRIEKCSGLYIKYN